VRRITQDVSAFLREHGVRRSDPVLCAVSGGADSSALAVALAALGQRAGVAHVHHGLRPEAERELDLVGRRARALGLPLHVARVDARVRDGRSPEERARALRYGALERLRRELGYAWTATAHSEDDQAETVLLRAIRGSGLAGLAGIAPIDAARRLLRPLLGVRRARLRAYLEELGLEWCEDSSNALLSVPRNHLRAEVLPRLEAIHPGATRKLAELASAARASTSALGREAEAALGRVSREDAAGVRLDARAIRALDPELRARVLLRLLRAIPSAAAASRTHVLRIERMLERDRAPCALSLPAGFRIRRSGDQLWLERAGSPPSRPKAEKGRASAESAADPTRRTGAAGGRFRGRPPVGNLTENRRVGPIVPGSSPTPETG
jgi:tRNA(Ile)-lysidine synthase